MAVFLIAVGASAFAQDRAVPGSKEQVMLSYAPLVKQVAPAVVNIYTKRVVTRRVSPFMNDPFFNNFFGDSFGFGGLTRKQVESSLGSGVIVDDQGLAITNAHVIKDAQEVSVVLSDGREFDADVALIDEPSDLAVLRIDDRGEDLPYAQLKPSESLEVGDIVIAIGNPFGVGQTVTSGIVSALARSSLNINDFNFFIQTDAAINPGNSGGPLVAMDGKVVGINTAIFSRTGGSLGIGFAIPSEMVATVLAAAEMGRTGEQGVIRPWLGVTGQRVTADIADSLTLTRPAGVLVNKLHRASPAKKAGLKVGDVILEVNGREIRDPAEMKFRLATVPIGEEAKLIVLREGKKITIMTVAMAPPNDPPRDDTALEGAHLLKGIVVGNLNPAVSVELDIQTDREGVVVLEVPRGTRGARFLRAGDILISINDDDIEDIGDLERELAQAARQGIYNIVLERDGQQSQIVIR